MAVFKPGDRVKRVRDPVGFYAHLTPLPIGATGVVTSTDYPDYVNVRPDAAMLCGEMCSWGCFPNTLEPIIPTAEDAFMEKMRQLARSRGKKVPYPGLPNIIEYT